MHLRELIESSKRIAAFTGAGISTESGISDYRSQGGLWDRYQVVTLQEFLTDENKRREYWRRKKAMFSQILSSRPNEGHLALARLEKSGKLAGIITQNIDGLHQEAGSRDVLEIHGTNREVICLDCGDRGPFHPVYERLVAGEEIPLCTACGGLLKPNTISFGQELDGDVLGRAFRLARECDLMIAAGSTLVVEPAASLPRTAKERGARLVIINRDGTPLDFMADLLLHDAIGITLGEAVPVTSSLS